MIVNSKATLFVPNNIIPNQIIIENQQQSHAFAVHQLCPYIKTGCAVLLNGDLGVGKTALTRYIIHHFCGDIDVASPSYNLIQEYDAQDFNIYHIDLYRLETIDDVNALAIEDMLLTGVVIVEWANQIPDYPWQQPYCVIDMKDDVHQHDEWRLLTISDYGLYS